MVEFNYTNEMQSPVFLLDREKIQFKNNAYDEWESAFDQKDKFLQIQDNLVQEVASHLSDNESVSFLFQIRDSFFTEPIFVHCSYLDEKKESCLVILQIGEENRLPLTDSIILKELILGGLMIVEIINDQYIARYTNEGLLKMVGYTREECVKLYNHDVLKLIYEEDIATGIKTMQKQIKQQKKFHLKGRLKCKNRDLIWVNFIGQFIEKGDGRIFLYSVLTDITQTQELLEETYCERQVYEVLKKISRDMMFKIDLKTEQVVLSGAEIERKTNRSVLTYELNDLLQDNSKTFPSVDELSPIVENIRNGITESKIVELKQDNRNSRWFYISYDFVYAQNKEPIQVVGEVIDVTEQVAARTYYEQAMALWTVKDNTFDSAVINLTQNKVIDGKSAGVKNQKLLTLSADDYFQKVLKRVIDPERKQSLSKKLNTTELIKQYYGKNIHFVYEVEIANRKALSWMRLNIELVFNPVSEEIMALVTWKNINDHVLQNKISKLLMREKYDFICIIFPDADSYMMTSDMEANGMIPNSMATGYEKFIKGLIDKYATTSDKEYLKFCFMTKNLKEQLKHSKNYRFIGHGYYPDGIPTTKLHHFVYLDQEKKVILYTRKDVTSQSERLVFQSTGGTVHSVDFTDVIYIESFGRKSCVITDSTKLMANEMISSIQEKLAGKKFVKCHRSYIVNCQYITSVEESYAKMSNGDSIPISRQMVSYLKNKLRMMN